MSPIEERVRASLRARAEDVEPTPHLYRGVQDRIARRTRLRTAAWALGGLAAVVAAVVVVPNLVSGLDQRTPEVADTPDVVETTPPVLSEGDPTHAVLGLDDGSLVLADLTGGDREVIARVDGQPVDRVVAAPGATVDRYRIVATRPASGGAEATIELHVQDGGRGSGTSMSTVRLPGADAREAPSIAISPDGDWLAYTGTAGQVDGAPAVHTVPIVRSDDGAYDLDLTRAQEVYAVTAGDVSDALHGLVQWTGDTGRPGDESLLHVDGGSGTGTIGLRRTDDGFAFEGRSGSDAPYRDAIDLSADFAGTDPLFLLTQGEGPDDLVLSYADREVTFHDLAVEGATLDGRGRTALLVAGGSASVVRFEPDGATVTDDLGDGVTAGALLGGTAPATADEDEDDPVTTTPVEPTGPLGDGLVVADDRTVTLVHPDGSADELVTFPGEGESTVVDVAVRPGSTTQDLEVAIVTRGEGSFDVRYLRVVDGAVSTDHLPGGERFPAPVVAAAFPDPIGAFPVTAPDLQDGGEMGAAWSPDGDLLAVLSRPASGAPNEVHTIGWAEEGPSADPNLAASFTLGSDRPLTLRGWSWTDHADGGAREGQLLLVDELAREAFTVELDRQGDGAPAMPAVNPLRAPLATGYAGSVLDLADADGDGTYETVLTLDAGTPRIEWLDLGGDGDTGAAIPVEASGPRDVSRIVATPQLLLVVLDPAQPMLVDRDDAEVVPAPLDGEVVSASAIR